ncbi:hypothetical protein BGP_4111 [Beggiatoa sp. PS]|nr:hypothetical protein BGP_4111 [Beggiatoa sp. PS]
MTGSIVLMSTQFSSDSLFDLNYNNLVPMMRLYSGPEIAENVGNSVPLVRGKILQWPVDWSAENTISKVYIKLGTCSRVNRCQLVLSVLQERMVIATAILDGATVQDNNWAEMVLDRPISSGKYFCQLQSPNADDLNTLFVWLMVLKPQIGNDYIYNLLDLYYYGLMPVMKLPVEPDGDVEITKSIPLLPGKTVQWQVDWQNQALIDKVLIKFGTCARINRCLLVLSILQELDNPQTVIAKATLDGHLVRDNDWTEFVLDRQIMAGKYQCQLQSPDADDLNTVFVWLMVAKPV